MQILYDFQTSTVTECYINEKLILFLQNQKTKHMELNLREKLILLFHHELKDKFCINDYRFDTAFIGAMLYELVVLKKIEIQDDLIKCVGKKDGLSKELKDMYARMKSKKSDKKISYWVVKLLTKSEKYRKTTLKSMTEKGLIEIVEKKYLLFFKKQTTHLTNPVVREEIVEKLRACLLDNVPASFDELAIISIIDAANVYRLISNIKGECPRMKEKYEYLLMDNFVGDFASDIILKIKNALFYTYNSYNPSARCSGR